MDGNDKYVGRILDNRYEIMELIGTGGMALVYRARCHRLNRMVAVKILKEDLADDEEFRRRFHTESQAVAMLSHPNIVAVYDVSRSGSVEYIVMELIEGITLKQYINKKGLLNWKEALHFATQVTKALNHAHSRGIIHRDIKPHNIMILKDGSVKVADFGIARLLSVQNTLTQEALGSVHYISPEQAKGGHVDTRSDIYSLGVVLYEMLTSRLPFVGESAVSVAIQHISAIPLMPRDINPDIPIGLEDIAMHAMEPDVNLRFTSAEEMLRDLEEFRKNPSIVFNYAMSDPRSKQTVDSEERFDTRVIPKGTAVRADSGAPVKPENNGIARVDRSVPGKKKAMNKTEMTSDEYRTVKTRASNTATLVGIFCVIVFIVILVLFMWQYLLKGLFDAPDSSLITIPTFVNRRLEDLSTNVDYTSIYEFVVDREDYSNEYPAGVIIYQNPSADRQQGAPMPGEKITIHIVVSKGEEEPVMMPDFTGRHYAEAINELERLYLNLKINDDPIASDTVDAGYVISTRPAAGEPIRRGFTVIITRSAGAKIVTDTVPDYLIGSTVEKLEEAFATIGLEPKYEYYSDEKPEGTVLYIQFAGQEVVIPSTIVVFVSSGPPETIPPVDTATPPPTDSVAPPTDTGTPTDTVSPEPTETIPPDPTPTEPTGSPPETPDPSPSGGDEGGSTGTP